MVPKDKGRLLLSFVADQQLDPAIDLLLGSSDRLRGYLLMRFARHVGGAEGTEIAVLEAALVALTRHECFDPEADTIDAWLFRVGIDVTQERIRSESLSREDEESTEREEAHQQLVTRLQNLPPDLEAVLSLDLAHSGRAPAALAIQELGLETADDVFTLREQARAALFSDTEQGNTSARVHQLWYTAVDACGLPPDLHPMTIEEAHNEHQLSPFASPRSMAELAQGVGPGQGMTVALIRAAQAGSDQALDTVLERFQPRILALVRGQLGRHLRPYVESCDVQQQANVHVLRSIRRFEPRGNDSFTGYLYVIVRNVILTLYRKKQLPITDDPLSDVPDPRGDEDDTPIEELEEALQLLGATHPRYEEALRLRLEGKSQREIGRTAGCTEVAARMRVVRARVELANILRRMRGTDAE